MSVILETTVGDVTVDLFVKERPRACLNFLKLCKIKYYNYCLILNIQRDFIAQTGDPTCSGKGGVSVFSKLYGDQAAYFEPETVPPMKHLKIGTLSMANNGNNMHGSQFFITLGENLDYLDDVHTVFGEVTEGLDVLQKFNEAIVDDANRPYQDIRINHTIILDDPFPDPADLDIPERSPSPTQQQLDAGMIAPGETLDEFNGKSKEEVEEAIKDKESQARAQILEMIGDIPDADVKPPDNVLFVCKLNAVTTDDDLLIIFSRFGPIKKCEVIRDQKSGESLQYAFIEFENEDDCASAYFKMDNVLIDDRRIHVDFSQSVSKLNWVKDGQRQPQTGGRGNQQADRGGRVESARTNGGPRSSRTERSPVRRRDSPDRRNREADRSKKGGGERLEGSPKRHLKRKSRSRSPSRDRNSKRHHRHSPKRSSPSRPTSSRSGHTSKPSRRRSPSSSRNGGRSPPPPVLHKKASKSHHSHERR